MLSLVGLVDINQVDNLMIDVELIATLCVTAVRTKYRGIKR